MKADRAHPGHSNVVLLKAFKQPDRNDHFRSQFDRNAVAVTQAAKSFPALLQRVEQGENIRISKRGQTRAWLLPDCDFIGSEEMSRFLASYQNG